MIGFLRFFKRKTKESWSIVSEERERAFAPHCDQTILHAPGVCEYCDHYADWQAVRDTQRINFTGEEDPDKAPCPSTYFRPSAYRDAWPGNTPEGYFP